MTDCKGITPSGEQCRLKAGEGSEYCLWHDTDPQKQAEAQALRSLGGQHRKTPMSSENPGEINSLDDVVRWARAALDDTWNQDNSDRRSRALSSLFRVITEALKEGDLSKRMTRMEELLNAALNRIKTG